MHWWSHLCREALWLLWLCQGPSWLLAWRGTSGCLGALHDLHNWNVGNRTVVTGSHACHCSLMKSNMWWHNATHVAYPGFIVMKTAQVGISFTSLPSKMNLDKKEFIIETVYPPFLEEEIKLLQSTTIFLEWSSQSLVLRPPLSCLSWSLPSSPRDRELGRTCKLGGAWPGNKAKGSTHYLIA